MSANGHIKVPNKNYISEYIWLFTNIKCVITLFLARLGRKTFYKRRMNIIQYDFKVLLAMDLAYFMCLYLGSIQQIVLNTFKRFRSNNYINIGDV